jgi:hypothetical protein
LPQFRREFSRVWGKPRRLSPAFLERERQKLNAYRKTMRALNQQKTNTDEAIRAYPQRLSIDDRVLALFPETYQVQVGTVRGINDSRYTIKFDDDSIPDRDLKDTNVMVSRFTHFLTCSQSLGKIKLFSAVSPSRQNFQAVTPPRRISVTPLRSPMTQMQRLTANEVLYDLALYTYHLRQKQQYLNMFRAMNDKARKIVCFRFFNINPIERRWRNIITTRVFTIVR